LTDFRCYHDVELAPALGSTVVVGANGQGKTTLLEAIGWVGTTQSFRGVPDAALVRDGCDVAVVRAEFERDGREQRLEAEIRPSGRNRIGGRSAGAATLPTPCASPCSRPTTWSW
jgi:DNA replication and repair protein RecF